MLRKGGAQASRIVQVDTPLGKDALLLYSMSGHEQLSQLFEFRLDLLADNPNIDMDSLLGQNVTVSYKLPVGGKRYFNGFVSEFGFVGEIGEYAHYQAVLRPWYWLLTRTSDSRIFQFMTVPDIIRAVFSDNGFSDYEMRLFEDYRSWEYCVQYRETDYNFLARLLEQEGIYYYFRHEAGKHTLVMCDSISAHDPYPGYEVIGYHPSTRTTLEEHIHQWRADKRVQPGKVVLNEFNFLTPRADLRGSRPFPREHAHANHEVYDYPGEYEVQSEGEQYARIRVEELQAGHARAFGQGDAGGIAPGFLFTLEKHSRDDQNQEYLVQRADYSLQSQDFESGGQGSPDEGYFNVDFTASPSREPYRPPRITPKPVVQGPQTAIVTGPPGEEIYPDKYGRIKVQFHWDRYGQRNENSSCWIRVSQLWAGKNWGAMHIPRIGQEVIVDFLEGDPDRPIATGRVYNADNMPPWTLPENKTQSGIKSRSSKGGSGANCNELRFEDKMGQEEVLLHAEKDQRIEVENDESHWVGHDREKTIDRDETSEIKRDRTETVGRNEEIAIGADRRESVGGKESITIGGSRTTSIGGSDKMNVGGKQQADVSGDRTLSVDGDADEKVMKSKSLTVNMDYACKAGMNISIEAGMQISLSVGASSIKLTPAMISISAPLVKIN